MTAALLVGCQANPADAQAPAATGPAWPALKDAYADLFALFVKHHDKIERVTFGGTTDKHSWLNGWPIKGRTSYPLLFDRQAKPKPAFDAVIDVARQAKSSPSP